MTSAGTLLIRADASTQIGTGHVMRCLALAQAWQEVGGDACFVLAYHVSILESRLQTEGMQVVHLDVDDPGNEEDAAATAVLGKQFQAHWIVVDGYHFNADYQQYLKAAGFNLLFLDDYGHAEHYYADVVLNQNIHAQSKMYTNRELYSQLLLGTKYALLRREFWQWQDWKRPLIDRARKILVTLGGSDPDNVTSTVMQALRQLTYDDLEAIVLVGGQNPHYRELEAASSKNQRIQLRKNVTNMPELMAWADLAVSAGGSTSWELAFMGLPSLILIIAENQVQAANILASTGAIQLLGPATLASATNTFQAIDSFCEDRELRESISRKARTLVDGRGYKRVVCTLNKMVYGDDDE